jgi:hypothetical protein
MFQNSKSRRHQKTSISVPFVFKGPYVCGAELQCAQKYVRGHWLNFREIFIL